MNAAELADPPRCTCAYPRVECPSALCGLCAGTLPVALTGKDAAAALGLVRDLLREMQTDSRFLWTMDERRLGALVDWFELVGDLEQTSFEAFITYAAALGCKTTWQSPTVDSGIVLPMLGGWDFYSVARSLSPGGGPRAVDAFAVDALQASMKKRLVEFVGSHETSALQNFARMFTTNEETP